MGVDFLKVLMSYGHTTVKAPYPIRTAKLSTVGPDQYYGRGLRGNLRCCKSLFGFFVCAGPCAVKVLPGFPSVSRGIGAIGSVRA